MQGLPTDYWAKFKDSPAGDGPKWLPLTHHMIDVAIMLRELLDNGYEKPLARTCGLRWLSEIQKQRMCLLAFLHDVGKAINDFQGQVFNDYGHRRFKGHTMVACSLFSDELVEDFLKLLPANFDLWFQDGNDDGEELFIRAFLATIGHHGAPVKYAIRASTVEDYELKEVKWSGWKYTDLKRLFSELADIMKTNWPKAFEHDEPLTCSAAFMNEFNGLLTLADWMASDDRHFDFHSGSTPLARIDFARKTAREMLEKSGRTAVPERTSFEGIFEFKPHQMQSAFIDVTNALYQ
ncbi:CRISPR-associated endonuclease Cas3'' [Roseibium sp. RKSG952]|uniref:CRISPR-associated endonuclease Cas3'' n=1 Tax=Roseibium sp. RKSG952 TaxID=2529384 RepID=UPI0012BBC391|nr:CRISPR-associated endonuclease Cas3'' [Roseibium sp. RKSG952]MTH95648.1 CRISPR-associated endonuclease Cas3'' [Roseibium sp. RKSG952]